MGLNAPSHSEAITVRGQEYHFVRDFSNAANKPKLYRSETTGQEVVHKTFCNDTTRHVAYHAYKTWEGVRDSLVAAGFPDILEATPFHQVYEYIPGITLANKADITPDHSTRIDITHSTIHSLSHHLDTLAEKGLAHGDVKPGNIVLRTDKLTGAAHDTMLIDLEFLHPFGARNNMIMHTVPYSPPEVASRNTYFPTSDIFSLGMTSVYTLYDQVDSLGLGQQPWGRDYFTGRSLSRRHGIPPYILEQFSTLMRDALSRMAPDRKPSIYQLVNFMGFALRTERDARPQSGREIRQILMNMGNITEV